MRDAISVKEYEPACLKLIGQFRTLWDSLRSSVGAGRGVCCAGGTCCVAGCSEVGQAPRHVPASSSAACPPKTSFWPGHPTPGPLSCLGYAPQVPDVEAFMSTYNMQCPMAAHRLIKSGVPGNQVRTPANTQHAVRAAQYNAMQLFYGLWCLATRWATRCVRRMLCLQVHAAPAAGYGACPSLPSPIPRPCPPTLPPTARSTCPRGQTPPPAAR